MIVITTSKLVRDKIHDLYPEYGYHTAAPEQRLDLLQAKLFEESAEVSVARDGFEALQELADLEEIVRAYTRALGYSLEDLEAQRLRKFRERGGFEEGWVLTRQMP